MTLQASQASFFKDVSSIESKESMNELGKKIDSITQFCSKPYFNKALKNLAKENLENAIIICDYIIAEQTEINIKQSTKEGKIKILIWLSNFNLDKSFRHMTKQDILDYLNNLRKPITVDRTQKWIGSYNGRQMILNKFFRWLYNPNESDHRKRISPLCMQGIKKLPRKEKTPYKHTDIWDAREHAIFLKYCPDTRDKCYHAMANDMSARPKEILSLKISDVKFNISEDHIQYAEVLIREGKTGPRTVPLIDSIPYLKEWIREHPSGTNPNSWLFVSRANNSFGQQLTYDGVVDRYSYYYKTRFFPKLLDDKTVPDPDKAFIRNMLTKPWNLYIFRHSALTQKSQLLSEPVLRDHAGWTMSSKMPEIYIHLNGESSNIILQKKGVIRKQNKEISEALLSKHCPNCAEPNKQDSRFCANCKMILTFDAYSKIQKDHKEKEDRLSKMEQQLCVMQKQVLHLVKAIDNIDDQNEINSFTKKLYSVGLINTQDSTDFAV